MSRNQSNSTLKFVGAAAAAIVGGVTIGYLFGGARPARPVEQVTPPASVTIAKPAPPVVSTAIRPHLTNGNYTAPGAPRIVIHEESTPHMRRVDQAVPALKPADSEATQEAAPPVAKPNPPNKAALPEKPSVDSTDTSAPPATNPVTNNDSAPAPPGDSTTPANPSPTPAPADPDFEHVNKHGNPESGQAGASKAQFRVQTGAYTDESNARSIADELRGQGYDTTTRSEHDGSHLIYKVQIGAYRSRSGAGKAADDLQKKGYTAYVSPITP